MVAKTDRFNLWIPLSLLIINIILTSFLIGELIDASTYNNGGFAFLTPIIGLISLLYIRKFKKERLNYFVWILQGLNWFFIIFPIAVGLLIGIAFV